MVGITNSSRSYLRISLALLHRDVKVLKKTIVGRLFDGFFLVGMQVINFGYLLPIVGMSKELIAPLYLANIVQIIFSVGHNFSMKTVADLQHNRSIDYHILLPLPKFWLFLSQIVSFMIECFLISAPLLSFGILLLYPYFPLAEISFMQLIIIYFISLLFFGCFFIYVSYLHSYQWFIENAWARRLSPLFLLGTTFYTWKKVNAFSPFFGKLFLLNPITYIVEGMRAACLTSGDFIPVYICAGMICCFLIVVVLRIIPNIYNRLDPV